MTDFTKDLDEDELKHNLMTAVRVRVHEGTSSHAVSSMDSKTVSDPRVLL